MFGKKKETEEPVVETSVLKCESWQDRTVVAKPNGGNGYGGITVTFSSRYDTVSVIVHGWMSYGAHIMLRPDDARATVAAILKVLDGTCKEE